MYGGHEDYAVAAFPLGAKLCDAAAELAQSPETFSSLYVKLKGLWPFCRKGILLPGEQSFREARQADTGTPER